jgi:hypothetical protein
MIRYVGVYWLADYDYARAFHNITKPGLRSPPSPIVTVTSEDGVHWVSQPLDAGRITIDTSLAEYDPWVDGGPNSVFFFFFFFFFFL